MQVKIKGILSFPHLFTARRVDEASDPKYSTNVLIHESDPQLAVVRQAVEAEKLNGFPSGFPATGKVCLLQSTTAPGYWEVRTSTGEASKPAVVDANLKPIIDPAVVYPGCIAWVAFNTYSYNKPMSKGVAGGLNAVMITGEEGPLGRLDNKPSVESLFGDVAGAAPVSFTAPPPAPSLPPPPPPVPQAPGFTMTALANGLTREAYHASGWSDEQLIANGMMTR